MPWTEEDGRPSRISAQAMRPPARATASIAIALCLCGGVALAFFVARVPPSSSATADTSSTTDSDSTETQTTGSGTTSTTTTSATTDETTTAAVTTVPPKPRRKPPARFELVAGGDLALAGSPRAATLTAVRGFFRRADLAIANLEGTLATAGSSKCPAGSGAAEGCFAFRASPAWARTLREAGFTDLNVANNHA